VSASSLSLLQGVLPAYTLAPNAEERDRRLALAKWLTSPQNPLTPRVMVNRVWQDHFGAGIVDTPSDFGYMGGRPTHPELLDYLASRFSANRKSPISNLHSPMDGFEWKLKPLHRLIVTSMAYRQAST